MKKTFAVLGSLGRASIFWKPLHNARCDLDRMFHLSLGESGMGADSLDGNNRSIGRERLVLDMTCGLAVDGVGEVRAEFFQIDFVDAASDFLIGREQDFDHAMPDVS